MIIFVTGEGVTDIGTSDVIGPMRKLIGVEYKYEVIHKSELKKSKSLKLPGKKDSNIELERNYFFNNAYSFCKIIKEKFKEDKNESDFLLAVFFRDADTIEQREWNKKYKSICDGFKAGQYEKQGVPMLPKTSSEVWLLSSVLNSHKMKNGKVLEEVRDRDYLKEELEKEIKVNVNDYNFDFTKISPNISSYTKFKKDLNSALSR